MAQKITVSQERRRASARRDCAVCLRLAARLASKTPHSPGFVVGMHARILSRALWVGPIVEANTDAIHAMITLDGDGDLDLRIALSKALWAANIGLGREPALPSEVQSQARKRPLGEVKNHSDLSAELQHADHRMDMMIQKGNATAARSWHERLLRLTELGRSLPIQNVYDAGRLLDDLWYRAKQYPSTGARRFRVGCRDARLRLWNPEMQPGTTLRLAPLLKIAQQLDEQADAELHRDLSKVVTWLDVFEGHPLAEAENVRQQRIHRLSVVSLGGRSIPREEIYDLVWSEPVTTVADRFGISDVALRKLCKRRSIPLPSLGYWAHLRRKGKGTKRYQRPPLPNLEEIL